MPRHGASAHLGPSGSSGIPLALVLPLAFAALAAPFVAFALYGLATAVAPTTVGPHRRFFAACIAIPRGASSDDVLERMRGYVLARRNGDLPVTAALLATRPLPTVRHGSSASFLFYPNVSDTADWCGVDFEQGRANRSWISPD